MSHIQQYLSKRLEDSSIKRIAADSKLERECLPQYILELDGMGLTGSIPTKIGTLTKLTSLVLSNNPLQGTIPDELGNLTRLRLLYLSNNSLTGLIPSTLGQLENLIVLKLNSNHIQGQLMPKLLSNLTQLEGLDVSSNYLNGVIPSTLDQLKNMFWLDLHSNQFEGTIPSTLGQLKNLSYLNLGFNQLDGTIPLELGNLTRLKKFDLSNNLLKGSILPTLGRLENLINLPLDSYQITGPIPVELWNLELLQYLNLSHNSLFSSIPSEIAKAISLLEVDFSHNITGSTLSSIPVCPCVKKLDLSYNLLNGSITSQIYFQNLDLSNNFLNGEVPQLLDAKSMLHSLDLSYKNLTGKPHKELATLSCINLSHNSFDFSLDLGYCSFREDSLISYRKPNFTPSHSIHQTNPQTRKSKALTIIALPIICFILLVFLSTLYFTRCLSKTKLVGISTKNGDLFSIWNYDGKIAFEDIIEATEDFHIKYCIGTGGYGSVYRAQLPSGNIVS